MSEIDIGPEAVEGLAFDFDNAPPCANNCGCAPACKVRTAETCMCSETAATLRALRAALTEAKALARDFSAMSALAIQQRIMAEAQRDQAELERDAVRAQLSLASIRNVVTKEREAAAADMRERIIAALDDLPTPELQNWLPAAAFEEAIIRGIMTIRALPLTSETKGGGDAAE